MSELLKRNIMTKKTIVDVHVHFLGDNKQFLFDKATYDVWEYGIKDHVNFSIYGGDPKDILKAMKSANVSWAIINSLFSAPLFRIRAFSELPEDLDNHQKGLALWNIEASLGERLIQYNHLCCDMAEAHPRLIPFIGADPYVLPTVEMLSHIQEMVTNQGAKGIKLHQGIQRFFIHEERVKPICKTCINLDIPILVHSGLSRGRNQYAEPLAFFKILKILPKIKLILAHLGGGAWRQSRELAATFPNVHFDCCEIIEWTGAPNAPTDRELAQLIIDVGPERVMLGSDFPWYDIKHTAERVMELPLLSAEQKEAVLGANAVRFLNLSS